MSYLNIREEELKNKVAQDYFNDFDCSKIIGNIDFCVTLHTPKNQNQLFETESLLWAEAKKGKSNILESITQLVLTIGKARTFDKNLPPAYLGAFDNEKIAFIPYNDIHGIFYQNDFNWNVTASNHNTKEFKLVLEKVTETIEKNSLLFNFGTDQKDLKTFIKINFIVGKTSTSKIRIDKNNFTVIYNKWLAKVRPTIAVDWDVAKKSGIIDGDFYLADLLSKENETLKDKLFVLLKKDFYEADRHLNDMGMFTSSRVEFKDKRKAHTEFWNKYERPPKKEYWDYIVDRRDLLVPQDVRERKGSFYTPQEWVELSQKYIADVFGEDWQDEYFIWDCAAGTGNLLVGLTNKYNIWASTLDQADVEVMHDRIDAMNEKSPNKDGANLLHDHVFKFDFLNDEFTNLPKSLQGIINDKKKSKKLLIYINPPYAEGDTVSDSEKELTRKGVAASKTYNDFYELLGKARGELFAQFFMRVYKNIPDSKLASFSTLKYITAENFIQFRNAFKAKYEKGFVVLANTFDNVIGKFPIGFSIWDLAIKEDIKKIKCDIIDNDSKVIGKKLFSNYDGKIKFLNDWLKQFNDKSDSIGKLGFVANDFQNQKLVFITKNGRGHHESNINQNNLIASSIYFAVRHNMDHTWLNHNDQFLFPNDDWESDIEFQNDCLAFTLFYEKNRTSTSEGTNNWIPFSEKEVKAHDKFESNFMTDFISGKLKQKQKADLFNEGKKIKAKALEFSDEAVAVFEAGKKLWQYYHKQPNCNVNSSLYDIREYFQGRNEKGKMNNKSQDETYQELIADLRNKLKDLAVKIEPSIYKYGFLKN